LGIVAGAEGDERRSRLWSNVRRFAAGLREAGLPAREDSAIFPVVTGTPDRAMAMAAHLREMGILAKPIRPPTVPQGTSRLRFAASPRRPRSSSPPSSWRGPPKPASLPASTA